MATCHTHLGVGEALVQQRSAGAGTHMASGAPEGEQRHRQRGARSASRGRGASNGLTARRVARPPSLDSMADPGGA